MAFWKTDKFLASFHHCFWYLFIYDYDSNFKWLHAFSLKYIFFASCILNNSSFKELSAYGTILGAEESNSTSCILMFNAGHWYAVTIEYERPKDVQKVTGRWDIPPLPHHYKTKS